MREKLVCSIKKGVFTVEAAVLVPLATIIIALLVGFVFFMHENVSTEAIAYETEFLAVQKTVNEANLNEQMEKRIRQRIRESSLGFGTYELSPQIGSRMISVNISGRILPAVFKDLFTRKSQVSIARIDPVYVKRLMWIGKQLKESE